MNELRIMIMTAMKMSTERNYEIHSHVLRQRDHKVLCTYIVASSHSTAGTNCRADNFDINPTLQMPWQIPAAAASMLPRVWAALGKMSSSG